MIRQHDALTTVFDGQLGIGDGLHTLQNHRTVPDRPQPFHVGPRKSLIELAIDVLGQVHGRSTAVAAAAFATAGGRDVGEGDGIVPQEVERPRRVDHAVDDRVETDLGRQCVATPNIALTTAQHRGVDGEQQRLVAGPLGPADHLFHQTAVLPGIDLEPLRALADRCHLFDAAGAHRRQAVRQAGTFGRPGNGQLSLRVSDATKAGWREGER